MTRFRHKIESEIAIKARPEDVWSVLTDFESYPEWNPFIRSIHGVPERGARLEVRIQPSGAKGMTFRPMILIADPGQELRWRGRLLWPGVFDGEHQFKIEPSVGGQVLFQQHEDFHGLLVPVLRSSLDRDTKKGFKEMNRALKARLEAAGTPG